MSPTVSRDNNLGAALHDFGAYSGPAMCAVPDCHLVAVASVEVARGESRRVCGKHLQAIRCGELELRLASEDEEPPVDLELVTRLARAVQGDPGVLEARLAQEVGLELATLRAHLPADLVRRVGARLYPVQNPTHQAPRAPRILDDGRDPGGTDAPASKPQAQPVAAPVPSPPAPSDAPHGGTPSTDEENTVDLTPLQQSTFDLVRSHPGSTANELAEQAGVMVQCMRGRLKPLEKKGLIESHQHQHGERISYTWHLADEEPAPEPSMDAEEPPPADPALLASANRAMSLQLAQLRDEKEASERRAEELDLELQAVTARAERAEARVAELENAVLNERRNHTRTLETASRDEESATEAHGLLADLCDLLFEDDARAEMHSYDGVKERAEAILDQLRCHERAIAGLGQNLGIEDATVIHTPLILTRVCRHRDRALELEGDMRRLVSTVAGTPHAPLQTDDAQMVLAALEHEGDSVALVHTQLDALGVPPGLLPVRVMLLAVGQAVELMDRAHRARGVAA